MDEKPSYWFRAKRYGWGWGLPVTWQGWVVFVGYLAAFTTAAVVLPTRGYVAEYLASVVLLTVVLIGICWLKGEPPRWRWGGE